MTALHPLGMPRGTDPREWRQSIEARLDDLLDRAMALVTALDLMEVDADLEPDADAEPSIGWSERMAGRGCTGKDAGDDREADDVDDEDGGDAEPWFGWQDEGQQARLHVYESELEPDLGTTEEVDQVRRLEVDPRSGPVTDGEPLLGFVGHGTGWREGEALDDREDEDEHGSDPDHVVFARVAVIPYRTTGRP